MAKETTATALQAKTQADIELMQSQAEAQFALSPMGQALKQFEFCQRMGAMMAQASIVPDTYKGNMPNCAIAVDMALRMNLTPITVMQNLYVVHGNPAWSSKFLIACIQGCGRFSQLEYRMKDNVARDSDEYGCRCVAFAITDTKKENPLYGPWVTWQMVKAEGWLSKNGSKWKTMPELMFRYRAAAMWQRLYAPELAMGINTVEEAYDSAPSAPVRTVDVTYTEVAPYGNAAFVEAAPVEISDERLSAALAELSAADTPEAVKAVRAANKEIYDNSQMFRDAVIDQYQNLENRQTQN